MRINTNKHLSKKAVFSNLNKLSHILPTKQDMSMNNMVMDAEDLEFIKLVLPYNLTREHNFYKVGDRFVTSIIITGYTAYLDDLDLATLFNEIDGVITLDVSTKPKHEQVQEVENSLAELAARETLNNKVGDVLSDRYQFQDMQTLHHNLQRSNEDIAYTTARIYVYGDSKADLESKVEHIQNKLSERTIKNVIPENEMIYEYRALQNPADTIKQPIPIRDTLARQFPFWHQRHIDPNGIFFGLTPTAGLVVLDSFFVSQHRKSFDILLIGLKGSGKSATIKSMIQDYSAMGHRVMAVDVEGELSNNFARTIGAKVVKPGYEGATNNPLQLRKMFSTRFDNNVELLTDDSRIADNKANYQAELSRIENFIHQYSPAITDKECDEFLELLEITYAQKGITEDSNVSYLPSHKFPLFSDVLDVLRNKLYSIFDTENNTFVYRPGLTEKNIETLDNLESLLKGLSKSIFNNYTSIDIEHESVVIFDISIIAGMAKRTYNAFMFDMLSLMWSEIYKNRERNSLIENPDDRTYCIAVMDEAPSIINIDNPQGLQFVEKLTRRARKYDAALWFAAHNARDFMPSGNTENLDKLRNIFALVQYKMLLQQDESSIAQITTLFPQFTESEILSTAAYQKGEMLISLGAGQKIRCKKYIPEEYFAYFDGGR